MLTSNNLSKSRPSTSSLILNKIRSTTLLFRRAIMTILRRSTRRNETRRPSRRPSLPLIQHRLPTNVRHVFRRITRSRTRINFQRKRRGKRLRLPFSKRPLLPNLIIMITHRHVRYKINTRNKTNLTRLTLMLTRMIFRLIRLPNLNRTKSSIRILTRVVPRTTNLLRVFPRLRVATKFRTRRLIFPIRLNIPNMLLHRPMRLMRRRRSTRRQSKRHRRHGSRSPIRRSSQQIRQSTRSRRNHVSNQRQPHQLPRHFTIMFLRRPYTPPSNHRVRRSTRRHQRPRHRRHYKSRVNLLLITNLNTNIRRRNRRQASNRRSDKSQRRRNHLTSNRSLHPPSRRPRQSSRGKRRRGITKRFGSHTRYYAPGTRHHRNATHSPTNHF